MSRSRKTTRRGFLKRSVAALALGGGLAWCGWWAHRHLARRRITRHFPYLKLDREGVGRFLADFEAAYGAKRLANAGESKLAKQYLLSTDFFLHDADESRTVRYVALVDPYVTPCYNPLARFV